MCLLPVLTVFCAILVQKNESYKTAAYDDMFLLLNNNLEADLLNGKGEAYGAEFYIEKKKGDLTGWISYTFSRSKRRVIGSFP